MSALLPCILCSDVFTNFLCIYSCAFGVDIYFVEFGDDIDEVLEVWSHFDHNQVFLTIILHLAFYFGNEVEVLQGQNCLYVKLADLI